MKSLATLRRETHAAWRDPAQICSQWSDAAATDARLLESHASRGWWTLLEQLGITLLVTREYENLVIALSARGGRPRISYLPIPHPSGMVYDPVRGSVWLASTRNPNQVYELKPASEPGAGLPGAARRLRNAHPLIPVASAFYPGNLYLHDLAMVGGALYGNAVGLNAVVELSGAGSFRPAWWPRCVELRGKPDFTRNYIQLNSIAPGSSLEDSFFTASSVARERLRPGHLRYPVDKRGVLFSGLTREPVCTGLTRPHSARREGEEIWVANSGYGEVGRCEGSRFQPVASLPGWTRGLHLQVDVAFVGTSRVIERYARYAPGLTAARCVCSVHAVCRTTGEVLARLDWPAGNQIFAIESLPDSVTTGFCFEVGKRRTTAERAFFSSYLTN